MFLNKILFTFFLLFVTPLTVFAADLVFSPDVGTFSVGKTFTVRVMSSSGAANVNAAEAVVKFDTDMLSVSGVSKDGSVFSLWTAEPEFSNTKGTVTFGGGSPKPFAGNKTLATITFKPKAEGEANLSFTEGSILAADGTGTDVLETKGTATYSIGKAAEPPAPSPSTITIDLPSSPLILSTTHPKEDEWYNVPDTELKWNVPNDISSLRLLFDENEKSQPTITHTPPVSEFKKSDLEDGEWYLHVMFKNGSGWGPVTSRKVLVDRTPPQAFSIETSQKTPNVKEVTLRLVEALDRTSGIDHYEVALDGATPQTLGHLDFEKGEYTISARSFGAHSVTIVAFDKAGNSREASAQFTLTGEDPTKDKSGAAVNSGEGGEGGGGSNLGFYLALIVTAIAGFLGGIMYRDRKHMAEAREVLKHETDEILEKTEIVFSLLRDEVLDQITRLSLKPNLSTEELAVLKDLKDALELSEELIDKEIDDVRKLVQ